MDALHQLWLWLLSTHPSNASSPSWAGYSLSLLPGILPFFLSFAEDFSNNMALILWASFPQFIPLCFEIEGGY